MNTALRFDHQLAAIISIRLAEEEREGHVGPHALVASTHPRIVDMSPIEATNARTAQHQAREQPWLGGAFQHGMSHDRLHQECVQRLTGRGPEIGLQVALHGLRPSSSCTCPVHPVQGVGLFLDAGQVTRVQQIGDRQEHELQNPEKVIENDLQVLAYRA